MPAINAGDRSSKAELVESPTISIANHQTSKNNQKSEIRNQKSEITNHKSQITNRKSQITNPAKRCYTK
jgi:hypothetical protein